MVKKCIVLMVIVGCILLNTFIVHAENNKRESNIIYFYSNTCAACHETGDYLESISNLKIIKYNVADKEGKQIFDYICDKYSIDVDKRTVPLIIVGQDWISGNENIKKQLESKLDGAIAYKYEISKIDNNFSSSKEYAYSKDGFAVFVTGFVNGLNPCSLAMMVVLISIIATQRKNRILLISSIFIISKLCSFLLFGTILYGLIKYINLGIVQSYLKVILTIGILSLLLGNVLDFVQARNYKYGKMKLQLPKKIRKYNEKIFMRILDKIDGKFMFITVFGVGILVSLTEFLCTGQIYLLSIISVYQYINGEMLRGFLYLATYNIGMICPLVILSTLVYKGKNILDVSEKIVLKTSNIKLLNILILGLMCFFVWKYI